MKVLIFLLLCTLLGCQKEKRQEKRGLTLPEPTVCTDSYIAQDQKALDEIEERFGIPAEDVLAKLDEIQKPLEKFHLNFPDRGYNVVSLPESSPYRIVKRLYLDRTPLGSPFFLEVRRYDKNLGQAQAWTLSLLSTPFKEIPHKKYPTYLGRGNRNQDLYDPSHGFSVTDRGIFTSFIDDGAALYVLYADAPWETFEPHLVTLLNVIPDEK